MIYAVYEHSCEYSCGLYDLYEGPDGLDLQKLWTEWVEKQVGPMPPRPVHQQWVEGVWVIDNIGIDVWKERCVPWQEKINALKRCDFAKDIELVQLEYRTVDSEFNVENGSEWSYSVQ